MSAVIVVVIACTIFVLFCLFILWDELSTLLINQVNISRCEILNEIEKLKKP